MMTDKQVAIVRALQHGLPLCEEPFSEPAQIAGVDVDELLRQIELWKQDGTIRRFGAFLNHHKAGFKANAMGVWDVADDMVELFGRTAAQISAVSHCYERPRFEGFPYNVYTMIHGASRSDCELVAKTISEATGVTDYKLLYTTTEFKKSSPTYFREENSPNLGDEN
jgi:DNA-binding Lrp family transcriptional regulator